MDITTNAPIEITGLAELAEQLPDGVWHEMRIRIRRTDTGAEVDVQRDLRQVPSFEPSFGLPLSDYITG